MTKKLLLVDDSKFIRMVMKKALHREDYTILEASNGQEALFLYEQELPDLVILDITMPDENGLVLLEQIKQKNPQAKVIMCSSMVYKKNVQEALEKGAIGFLPKPFQDSALLQIIHQHM